VQSHYLVNRQRSRSQINPRPDESLVCLGGATGSARPVSGRPGTAPMAAPYPATTPAVLFVRPRMWPGLARTCVRARKHVASLLPLLPLSIKHLHTHTQTNAARVQRDRSAAQLQLIFFVRPSLRVSTTVAGRRRATTTTNKEKWRVPPPRRASWPTTSTT
jgi:hypothetical protein